MSSKRRVFSHSPDINFNDYIKNKNVVEILQNIKQKQQINNDNHRNNFLVKKFSNHSDLIDYTKTYYNYVNLNNYSLQYAKNLYTSNISFVDNQLYKDNTITGVNNFDNLCPSKCGKSKIHNECLQLSQVLYPESTYVSNNNLAPYLHSNLNMEKWCVKNFKVDYNKIYNSEYVKINIDGFNGCINGVQCCNIGPTGHIGPTGPKRCNCKKKCKHGLCKNPKPLFYV